MQGKLLLCRYIPVYRTGGIAYPEFVPVQIQIALSITGYNSSRCDSLSVDTGKSVSGYKITEIIIRIERTNDTYLEIVVVRIFGRLKLVGCLRNDKHAIRSSLATLRKHIVAALLR